MPASTRRTPRGSEPLEPFRRLGDRVQARWTLSQLDVRRFAGIAAEELRESDLARDLDWLDVAKTFLRSPLVPPQFGSTFGQPQLTLYRQARFYVEVVFWLDGTTEIHGHAFRGAFQVLAGSSLHARHELKRPRRISSALVLGDVELAGCEILGRGDVREITGAGLVHSLFHLERPSATIVVRTMTSDDGPQLSYLPPHVAHDPDAPDRRQQKDVATLELVRRVRPKEHLKLLREHVATRDLHSVFLALGECHEQLAAEGTLDAVLAAARRVHGRDVDDVVSSLVLESTRARLVRLREEVHDPDHRFLLALLLNLRDRDAILAMVAARTGRKPAPIVAAWLRAMSKRIDAADLASLSDVLTP